MGEEIKVVQDPIEAALANMQSSIQSMETAFSTDITGENKLEMVDKLNEIRQDCEAILTAYQTLITSNVEATRQSVESFVENEEAIASAIQPLKY